MLRALKEGFRAVRRSWGLALLLLAVNVSTAAVLAVPLAGILENDLRKKDSAYRMMYGFDPAWWSEWSDRQSGWTSTFGPDILGVGFAFKNVDLLLKGVLPAGLFVVAEETPGEERGPALDGVILGLGVLYLVLQTFLAGGILGVLRGAQGEWTVCGLLHGSGFYFGRFLRLLLVTLAVDFVLFRLNGPFAGWADERARGAVSESAAMAWLLGRHGLLLLAILFVHMLSTYAKVITVLEERSSALLAFLSSVGFCLRNLVRTLGHYLAVVVLAVLLLLLWRVLDGAWVATGYRTQVVAVLLGQGLVLGRIALRLALMGGQIALYRRLAAP